MRRSRGEIITLAELLSSELVIFYENKSRGGLSPAERLLWKHKKSFITQKKSIKKVFKSLKSLKILVKKEDIY